MPGDDLVRRAQTGDVRALEQLCSREWRPVYAIVYASTRNPLDAEDLTQEVFLRALKAFGRDEDRDVPFRAFLATVARNLMRNRWRHKTPVQVGLDSAPEVRSNTLGPEEDAILHSDLGHLAEVFSTLPDDYQLVLQLRVLEGLPSSDVAERMQRSPAAVRVLQHRALAALRAAFIKGPIHE
jgi:RNA polymerase sigma-70 factor, ECF subfamily